MYADSYNIILEEGGDAIVTRSTQCSAEKSSSNGK